MAVQTDQYHTADEVVAIAHELGVKHITKNGVYTAAYQGSKPLKKTKINGRIYFRRSDINKWLEGDDDN